MARRLETSIETERLVLRSLEESDLDDIVAEVNDFAVSRMLARVPFPYSRTDAEGFLAANRRSSRDFNLVLTKDGKAIGCIGLTDVESTCEFGYWLGQAHWRQGLASEAARAFLAFSFDGLGVETITSGVFADNPASLRVQEKLGFEKTGSSFRQSLARGHAVAHIDTALTRNRFAEATR
jgi:RimJ/RimL family protein N-acetyltransferase